MSVIQDNMNPYVIREEIKKHIGSRILVKIYGIRNKNDSFTGIIKDVYTQIFTVQVDDNIKSFSYSDLINGEVEINYI